MDEVRLLLDMGKCTRLGSSLQVHWRGCNLFGCKAQCTHAKGAALFASNAMVPRRSATIKPLCLVAPNTSTCRLQAAGSAQ